LEFLIEQYLSDLSKVRSPLTVKAKESYLKHLTDYTDTLIDFDKKELSKFYEHLKKKGLKDTTIKQVVSEAKRFYNWLREQGYSVEFESSSAKFVFQQKGLKNKERKRYTDEEIDLVLRAIRGEMPGIEMKHPIYYLLVTFLVSSGLRIAEAVEVKKEDITVKKVMTEDGKEKEVWFVEVREGKFGKSRTVPIFFWKDSWKKLWEEWLRRLKPEDYIFTYTIRYPRSVKTLRLTVGSVWQFFYRLSKELKTAEYNLKVTAHRFRYTYITKLGMIGIPVSIVSKWVGHERITTTLNIYMEAEEEKSLELIVEKM